MIHIITPSRGRPEKLKRMWQSALQTAAEPDKLFLHYGIHVEEEQAYGTCLMLDPNSGFRGATQMYFVKDWGTVHSVNFLAAQAMTYDDCRLMYLVGDDTIFSTPCWDTALRNEYATLKNKVHIFSLLDSRDENGTPHPVVTREFWNAMGYLACPIFMHWYADSWLVEVAKSNGCFTHLKEYLLIHDKDSDRGKPDWTHQRIRNNGWKDRDYYLNEKCQHLLDAERCKLNLALNRPNEADYAVWQSQAGSAK